MTLSLALTAVLLTAALLASCWRRLRVAGRSGLVLASVLSVVTATALQVNDLVQAYPSNGTPAPAFATAGSQLLTVSVAGRASGLTLQMYVYLPAAYRTGHGRYPVIEALHGYPGSPKKWPTRLQVQSHLDQEIAAGRMPPTIVIFPWETPQHLLDTECTNLVRGPQAETFVTVDVPAYVTAHYRARPERAAWGLTGYSAGAFCAINLALRHPSQYAAAASLSGYSSPGIKIGDGSEYTTNNPGWRLGHLPQPAVALWLGWAADDKASAR
jgi:enterochelin esterase-like enzyme